MDAPRTPGNPLDPKVKTAWRLQTLVGAVFFTMGALAFFVVAFIVEIPLWIPLLSLAITVGLSIMWLTVVPEIRYRRWRWEVADEEIRLQEGLIVISQAVIPMVRVQHVDTAQGPIMRPLGLSDVHIFTAAGQHTIPALADNDAAHLRDRIAVLARVSDDGGL